MRFLKYIWKNLKIPIFFFVMALTTASVFAPIFYNTFVLPFNNQIREQLIRLMDFMQNSSTGGFLQIGLVKLIDHEILITIIFLFFYFLCLQIGHFVGGVFKALSLPVFNRELKKKAFFNTLKLNLEFFRHNNPGAVEKNITIFADSFCQVLESAITISSHCTQLFISLYFCFQIKLVLALFFIWNISVLSTGFLMFKKLGEKSEKKNIYQNLQSGLITETLNNIFIFKIFKNHKYVQDKFFSVQKQEDNEYFGFLIFNGLNKFTIGMINVVFFCLCTFLICRLCNQIPPNTSLIFFYSQFLLVLTAYWNIMWNILPTINQLGRFINSYQFVENLATEEIKENTLERFNDLEIKNLNFVYKNTTIIHDLSFKTSNEFVLINGPSGGGKSTLLNLVGGLNKSPENTVFINNKDINTISNPENFISCLSQTDFIFNDSIKNNITLQRDYDENKLNMLLELTNLSKIFKPEEINNKICGVNGSQISGGQAKRICFCRSMLFDTPDKLILLDEPFNNLDNALIENLLKYLASLKGKRTVLCIDHTGFFESLADKTLFIELKY